MDATKFGLNAYLKPEDVQASAVWTIVSCNIVTVKYPKQEEAEERLQLLIDNGKVQKQMTLNKHNVSTLIDMFGSETDDWIGKQIKLVLTPMLISGEKKQVVEIEGVSTTSAHSVDPETQQQIRQILNTIKGGSNQSQ